MIRNIEMVIRTYQFLKGDLNLITSLSGIKFGSLLKFLTVDEDAKLQGKSEIRQNS